MTDAISIWRWQVTEDPEAMFARLIAASDDAFSTMAGQMAAQGAQDQDSPTPQQLFQQAEEKVRSMNLPPAELATTLAGLKAMREEAEEDWAEDTDDLSADPTGRVGVALASSHMFFDDPYAGLEHSEIERQVGAAMDSYRAAISNVVGHEGQSIAAFLGIEPAHLYEDTAFDVLMAAGLAEVRWIWGQDDAVLFLSLWHEDKELPIDLEFSRAPVAQFADVRAQLS